MSRLFQRFSSTSPVHLLGSYEEVRVGLEHFLGYTGHQHRDSIHAVDSHMLHSYKYNLKKDAKFAYRQRLTIVFFSLSLIFHYYLFSSSANEVVYRVCPVLVENGNSHFKILKKLPSHTTEVICEERLVKSFKATKIL